jgi:hypothetical protein
MARSDLIVVREDSQDSTASAPTGREPTDDLLNERS